ncbi:hypothetical protein [Dactylosporangium sp. CA-233914]|uniref:hypothetical protein n=1 Tax=Dactylosporangium sp. CA-233914 TaxID=3239934 RepID=UPI003D8FE613
MARVLIRHEAAREALPECWMLHGEVVENLLWIMDTWMIAYHDPASTAVQVADWHERRLPGLDRGPVARRRRPPAAGSG